LFRIEKMEKTVNLLDLSPEGIASFLVSIGEKPVFTGKIIRHLFECRNTIIDEPSYLPESLKHKLRQISGHAALEVLEESKSADGKNIKTLLKMATQLRAPRWNSEVVLGR
jgi:adenine C2-methylase RlmN of 23S rRNA A2503 and tRNA A37